MLMAAKKKAEGSSKKLTPRSPAGKVLPLVQFRAEPEWTERAKAEAKKMGITLSGLIRQAVNQFLEERARRERGE